MTTKRRIRARSLQRWAASTAAVLAVALAVAGVVFFRAGANDPKEPFWRLLLSDRVTLGFVRLATVALALYVISSVAALAAGERWLKSLSAGGFEADEIRASDEELAKLEAGSRAIERDLDQVIRLLRGPGDG